MSIYSRLMFEWAGYMGGGEIIPTAATKNKTKMRKAESEHFSDFQQEAEKQNHSTDMQRKVEIEKNSHGFFIALPGSAFFV